ncbi:UNVERIFIED_CONTAM: hypothetical protein HDU68_001158 [Siphonaria sp. JEL0065]|nr:hypothetical protein HDU68_001158 [Siphonaria sp. JEL0065]
MCGSPLLRIVYLILVSIGRSSISNLNANFVNFKLVSDLAQLTELTSLQLDSNQIHSTIPTEFGLLTKLKTLNLGKNVLTGPIPTQLGRLTALWTLDLSQNNLTGSIPTQFGNLQQLIAINLLKNQLTGTIPTEFGNFPPTLQTMMLSSNQLEGALPSEFGKLAALQNLGPIPNQFIGMTSLTYINLMTNRFSGDVPDFFNKYPNKPLIDYNCFNGQSATTKNNYCGGTTGVGATGEDGSVIIGSNVIIGGNSSNGENGVNGTNGSNGVNGSSSSSPSVGVIAGANSGIIVILGIFAAIGFVWYKKKGYESEKTTKPKDTETGNDTFLVHNKQDNVRLAPQETITTIPEYQEPTQVLSDLAGFPQIPEKDSQVFNNLMNNTYSQKRISEKSSPMSVILNGAYAGRPQRPPVQEVRVGPETATRNDIVSKIVSDTVKGEILAQRIQVAGETGVDAGQSSSARPHSTPRSWNVEQTAIWAGSVERVGPRFWHIVNEHQLTFENLLQLSRTDLQALGLSLGEALDVECVLATLLGTSLNSESLPPSYSAF